MAVYGESDKLSFKIAQKMQTEMTFPANAQTFKLKLKLIMKRINFLLFLCLLTGQLFSQTTNCDSIKKQNIKLQDKLNKYGINLNDSLVKVKSFNSDINVNFIKCLGDKKTQTVTLYFNLTNSNLPNQQITIYKEESMPTLITQAFDEIGQGYLPLKLSLGAFTTDEFESKISNKLSTGNTPILAKIIFANILGDIKMFKQVDICMASQNLVGGEYRPSSLTELRNIEIVWK